MTPHPGVAPTVEPETVNLTPCGFESRPRDQGGNSAHVFTSLGERAPRSVDNHAVLGMGRVRPRRRSTSISMRLLM